MLATKTHYPKHYAVAQDRGQDHPGELDETLMPVPLTPEFQAREQKLNYHGHCDTGAQDFKQGFTESFE